MSASDQEIAENGWKAQPFPVEAGCGGLPAKSVWRLLSALGIDAKSM